MRNVARDRPGGALGSTGAAARDSPGAAMTTCQRRSRTDSTVQGGEYVDDRVRGKVVDKRSLSCMFSIEVIAVCAHVSVYRVSCF